MMTSSRHRCALMGFALLGATTLSAQTVDSTRRVPASARKSLITFNPIGILAEYISGDVEFRTAPSVTVGVGGTWNGIDRYNDYRALEAKVRYYPGEKALQGFSIAGTAGFGTIREITNFNTLARQRVSRPSLGTELSYQWLLGPSHKFVVVIGAGLKRMLGTERNADPLNIPLLPTGRLNIGFAF